MCNFETSFKSSSGEHLGSAKPHVPAAPVDSADAECNAHLKEKSWSSYAHFFRMENSPRFFIAVNIEHFSGQKSKVASWSFT